MGEKMIEKFLNKMGLILEVKTNLMNKGVCYFGKIDIQERFDTICRELQFESHIDSNPIVFMITVYNRLKEAKIKPHQITYSSFTYSGEKMTELSDMKPLDEE